MNQSARTIPARPTTDQRPCAFKPSAKDVEELITRASRDDLGTDLLLNGALDAVSARFGVHAFTVEEAREKLRGR